MQNKKILVTGGAGYVGSVLVPKLLNAGYSVNVLDLYLFGKKSLSKVRNNPKLNEFIGDIRDVETIKKAVKECSSVIHLACISNDPSFELNPLLGKSINYDAFPELLNISIDSGVQRFIYASSSSVYGLKEEENVTENLSLKPLTDYSKYKALCEEILLKNKNNNFTPLIIRPATVCGYSPRQRLDLIVNILTNHAFNNRKIQVFGGEQKRPNIHIQDMTDLYLKSLEYPKELIDSQIFNAGYENFTVNETANIIQGIIGEDVLINTVPTDDNRSYHISSEKIYNKLNFKPQYGIKNAVNDMLSAFQNNLIINPMTNNNYYNIKVMQSMNLK
ncbi:MAG: NAD-dependent epimerase/dehydratase family protein [Dehalococcoidia bacterium]